jgi:hypothetical protein
MNAEITEVYAGYNFDRQIHNPIENQKGCAVVEGKWAEVIYKNGKWVITHKPK